MVGDAAPRRGRRAAAGVLAVLALAVGALVLRGVTASAAAGVGEPGRVRAPDVKVGVWEAGGCPPLSDSLPTLVTMTDVTAGDVSPLVRVCVANVGTASGRLTLGVLDRTDLEIGCSGDEAVVDSTCGTGQGELAGGVVQLVGALSRCDGPLRLSQVGFGPLSGEPVLLDRDLRPGQRACVALAVTFAPRTDAAERAAQTDRLTWRYAVDLTAT